MARGTVDDRLHTLHVGLPCTVGTPMRVGDLDAKGNALVAELALSHPLHLLAVAYFHTLSRHRWYSTRKLSEMQAKISKNSKVFSAHPPQRGEGEGVAKPGKVRYNTFNSAPLPGGAAMKACREFSGGRKGNGKGYAGTRTEDGGFRGPIQSGGTEQRRRF